MEQLVLVLVLAAAVVVALAGFLLGDRRRRAALGQAGPRPARSVGEAVRLAAPRRARVLVLFLGSDESSVEAGRALAEDPTVLAALRRPDLVHAVIRSGPDDREVSATIYEKYAKEPLPQGPAALLLDADGALLASAELGGRGPLAAWLPGWSDPPRRPA